MARRMMFCAHLIAGLLPVATVASASFADEVITIGPKVKRAIDLLTDKVNTVVDNSRQLEKKKESLKELGDLIVDTAAKGGKYERYPAVTEGLKNVYLILQGKLIKESEQMLEYSAKTRQEVDGLDQIKRLSKVELKIVAAEEKKLDNVLVNRIGALAIVRSGAGKKLFGPVLKVAGEETGLTRMPGGFLPKGLNFDEDEVVPAHVVVFNLDGKNRHTGDFHVKVLKGPARVIKGNADIVKIRPSGKYAIMRVENVKPYEYRIITFSIEVGGSSSDYSHKFFPFKLPFEEFIGRPLPDPKKDGGPTRP